jgi:hypothetical protein
MDTLPTAANLKRVAIRDLVANEIKKACYKQNNTLDLTFDIGPEVTEELRAKGYHVDLIHPSMSNLFIPTYTRITW